MKRAYLLLLCLLLAGCNTPPDDVKPEPPGPSLECLSSACPADLDSLDARRAVADYNLTQISADATDEANIVVEGDWLVWQADEDNSEDDDMVAFNMRTREFLPIDIRPNVHSIRPFIDNGLVFYQAPMDTNSSPIAVWSTQTKTARPFEVPFNPGSSMLALNGSWMGFMGRIVATNQTGMFLWNMETDELIHLYSSHPYNKLPDGSFETFVDIDFVGDVAYYAISHATAQRENRTYNATIYRLDLESRETREYFFNDGINNLDADRNFLVLASGLDMWALNLTSGQFFLLSGDDVNHCGQPNIRNDWVVYGCNHAAPILRSGIWVKNLADGRQTVISFDKTSMIQAVTNGNVVVVQASLNDPDRFQHIRRDLYWTALPD